MADANRPTSPVVIQINGITIIERARARKGERLALRDDEIALDKRPHCDRYTGTATALCSAGIIELHMLSWHPESGRKAVIRATRAGKNGESEQLEIVRKNVRLVEVRIGIAREERARRQQERSKLLEAEQAAQRLRAARQREELELRELPRSHEQFREACVKTLRAHLKIVRDTTIAANKFSGFHFDEDVLHAFDKAAHELVRTLLRGGTRFDPATQERRIIEIKSQSSKADMPLQSFLQRVTAQTDGEEESAT